MIGGSGLYELIDDGITVTVPTPYGEPSDQSPWGGSTAGRWRSCPGTARTTATRPTGSTTGDQPEAVLARELTMCYFPVALVTGLDAGIDAGSAVSHAAVLEMFAADVTRLRDVPHRAVVALPAEADCRCAYGHEGVSLPITLP